MSNKQPKISIIVPIYNVSKYLDACLQSLVSQTLEDIEIICVDDKSTDESPEIIRKYMHSDGRVKAVWLEKNSGTLVARKKGVQESQGQYIMFCDGDDQLVPKACETVWSELEKDPVDIFQFGTKVRYSSSILQKEKDSLENLLKPYTHTFSGNLCKACFKEKRWGFTIWNKAYASLVCKKACSETKDEHVVIADDLYQVFMLSYFAKSYRGIKEKLYVYNFGAGVTGKVHLNYEDLKKQMTKLNFLPALDEFLKRQNAEKEYLACFRSIKNEIIESIIYMWKNSLSVSDAREGYELLIEKMGACEAVSELARTNWDDGIGILNRLTSRQTNRQPGKNVKRIGVYYHRLRNGGVERVLSKLLVIWKYFGYDIILLTDEEKSEDDYKIPDDIERVVLPSFVNAQREKYKQRAKSWTTMINHYELDTIIYHSCSCPVLLWDVCLIKGLGCNLIIETHSMFCGTMWYDPLYSSILPKIYRMVDRVVALSKTDVTFWNNYCPAIYIPNPIELAPKDDVAKLDTNNILWVGRFAEEKKPYHILEAFSIIYDNNPEATLTIVGDGDSPEWRNGLERRASELKISQAVEFCGYEKDVTSYYKQASVLAITSLCESFSMVLAESKSYGVPVVMYELPNIELAKDKKGIIAVPQDDVLALANSILEVLGNNSLRKKMGEEARQSIEDFLKIDIGQAWNDLFADMKNVPENNVNQEFALVLDMLLENVYRGIRRVTANYNGGNENAYIKIHEEVLNRHEEVVNRHEEVVNRHEEVLNRHEEVVNRHETSINHQWEVQKWHEERLQVLEKQNHSIKAHIKAIIRIVYHAIFE